MTGKLMFVTASTGHTLTANCKDGKECKSCEFKRKKELESERKIEVKEMNNKKIYSLPIVEMKWNKDGSPDFSDMGTDKMYVNRQAGQKKVFTKHVNVNPNPKIIHNHERTKDNKGVPKIKTMKWLANGKPDLSEYNKGNNLFFNF